MASEPDFSPPGDPAPEHDPYGVPQADLGVEPAPAFSQLSPHKTRRRYHEQEGTVRHLGAAFMAVAMALFVYGGVTFVTVQRFMSGDVRTANLGVAAGFTLFALVLGLSGLGLWLLKPAARIVGVVVSVLLLVICPCGSWLGIYAMILLLSKSTVTVFSEDYADVIAATPRLRPRPPGATLLVLWTPALFLIVMSVLGTLNLAARG